VSSSASELIHEFFSDFRTDLLPIYVEAVRVEEYSTHHPEEVEVQW